MQQWIPKGHTLEPKIWGEIGLRQALYIGFGVFWGILLFFALSRFGLLVRFGGLVLPPCLGAALGFLRIKGLMPERYLLHRLRFRLRRAGTLGVWDTGVSIGWTGGIQLGDAPVKAKRALADPVPAKSTLAEQAPAKATPPKSTPTKPAPAKPISIKPAPVPFSPKPTVSTPVAYLVEAGAFGLVFTAAAWAVASGMLSYAMRGVLP